MKHRETQVKSAEYTSGSEKIRDKELRSFLEARSNETAQVLLEVEAPEPKIRFQPLSSTGEAETAADAPYSVEFAKDCAERERKAIEATRLLLESMKVNYQFSRSARVFAVGVTPGQLRKLLAAALIRAVVPNRRVKM